MWRPMCDQTSPRQHKQSRPRPVLLQGNISCWIDFLASIMINYSSCLGSTLTVAPQRLHSGSTVEIHGNPLIFLYFSNFLGYFLNFWSNIKVFGQNKVGIVQTPPRSAEISRYFVKRSHLDPKRLTFEEIATPLKNDNLTPLFFGFQKVGDEQTPPRSPEINRYFVKRSRLDPKRNTFEN